MGHRRKRKPGPQNHAEGQHGERAHARFIEQLHEAPPEEPVHERVERKHIEAAYEGKRRLVEDREQHDEAEKNSERTRLFEETRAAITTTRGRATTVETSTVCSATESIGPITRSGAPTD